MAKLKYITKQKYEKLQATIGSKIKECLRDPNKKVDDDFGDID